MRPKVDESQRLMECTPTRVASASLPLRRGQRAPRSHSHLTHMSSLWCRVPVEMCAATRELRPATRAHQRHKLFMAPLDQSNRAAPSWARARRRRQWAPMGAKWNSLCGAKFNCRRREPNDNTDAIHTIAHLSCASTPARHCPCLLVAAPRRHTHVMRAKPEDDYLAVEPLGAARLLCAQNASRNNRESRA